MSHIERPVKTPSAPRPLKSQSRSSLKANYMVIEELIQLIENVALALQSGISNTETMGSLVQNLRLHGPQLETISKDTLDRAFVVFRNASQDERLNIMTRLKLLELIELRAKSWEDNGSNTYYKTKQATNVELPHEQLPYQQHVDVANAQSAFLSTSPTFGAGGGGAAAAASAAAIAAVGTPQQQHLLLSPGEVIRNSGKFLRPTKIPGKTYCKDEVVIRNADSGKVMGIKGRRVHMIEELSETIISFQRVNPGAKERLVQITGPAEDKINYAKQLMEDTIRRNASPVRLEPAPAAGGGSCSSLASSNSDEAVVQPRTPSGSSIANRLSFNSAQNFMTATAAAQQISQQQQHHHQQLQQQQQQVVNMLNHNAAAAAAANAANAAAGKVLRANQQTLLHSYSTNDASVGEYKFTVPVGQHLIKITGDCCDLVRVAKLVLDDYFSSSEFLASVEAGAAFDGTSVISPIATPTTPLGPPQFMLGNPLHNANTPLADSGIGLNYLAGGAQGNNNNHDGDDEVFVDANGVASQNGLARSRRSHFSRKDSTPEAVNNNNKSTVANTTTRPKAETTERASVAKSNPTRITYEYEYLLYYSKSPHAWNFPADWDKICEKSPSIVRNKVKGGLPLSYNDNILTMSLAPSSPNVVNVHANSKMIANDTANKPFPSTTTAKQSVTNNHSNETITNVNTKPYLGEGKSSTTHEITNMNSTSLTTNSTTSGISRVAQKPLRKPLACRQNYISDSSDSLMLQNDTISCSTEYDMSLSSARYGSTCSLRSSLNGAAALDAQKLFNKQLKLISNAVEHNNDNDRQQLLQKQSKVKIQYEVASANIGNDEDVVIDLSNVDATNECHNNNCCSSQNYKNISDSEVDFKQKSTTHNHMQRTHFTCDCTPNKT